MRFAIKEYIVHLIVIIPDRETIFLVFRNSNVFCKKKKLKKKNEDFWIKNIIHYFIHLGQEFLTQTRCCRNLNSGSNL